MMVVEFESVTDVKTSPKTQFKADWTRLNCQFQANHSIAATVLVKLK
jgi:hypothetical protein